MGMAELPIRRLTIEETLRMVDAGILGKSEPVELLEGVLVEMSPQGPAHANATVVLADRLRGAYAGGAMVREEKPLVVGKHSLPEPDIAVVRGGPATYARRHPQGKDTILAVELALSSHRLDRRKASVYAAAGIPVYWIVDLVARKLEIRSSPDRGAYLSTQVLGENETVPLPALTETWLVRDLLPPGE